jgi:hypothetical protein
MSDLQLGNLLQSQFQIVFLLGQTHLYHQYQLRKHIFQSRLPDLVQKRYRQ